MKKLIYFILILAIVFGVIYFFKQSSSVSNNSSTTSTVSTSKPDASNATFQFDDGPITLKQGTNQTSITADNLTSQETDLDPTVGYGDINNDGKTDAVVILSQSGGGSGTFIYLSTYVSNPLNYKGTNAIYIGDRVAPQSITVSNGIITLKYLDRKSTDSFAVAPSILTTEQFTYSNGALVQK